MVDVLSPRVILGQVDEDTGNPKLPRTLGGETLWDWKDRARINGYAGWEYRLLSAGTLTLVIKLSAVTLPDTTPGAISLVWVLAPARDGDSPLYERIYPALRNRGIVLAHWKVNQRTDGALAVPSLETDASAEGALVKAWWPADWRVRKAGDSLGDPFAVPPIPPSPPTGVRRIGLWFA